MHRRSSPLNHVDARHGVFLGSTVWDMNLGARWWCGAQAAAQCMADDARGLLACLLARAPRVVHVAGSSHVDRRVGLDKHVTQAMAHTA